MAALWLFKNYMKNELNTKKVKQFETFSFKLGIAQILHSQVL